MDAHCIRLAQLLRYTRIYHLMDRAMVPSQYLAAAAGDRSMGIEAARTTTLYPWISRARPLGQRQSRFSALVPRYSGDSRSAGGRDPYVRDDPRRLEKATCSGN